MTRRVWLPACLCALLLPPLLAQAQTAKVTAVVLDVKSRPSASAGWGKVRVGSQLAAGAQVRTGKRSKCEIRFPDGSLVRMAPLTDMTIARVPGKDLSLAHGKIYARIVAGTTARIQGGTGVASIKGTVLEFDAGDLKTDRAKRRDVLTIFEGLAELSGAGGTQLVGPNTRSGVGGGGAPSQLTAVPAQQFASSVPTQWWDGVQSGKSIVSTPSSSAGEAFRDQTLSGGRQNVIGTPGRYELQNGTIVVDIESARAPMSSAQTQRRVVSLPVAAPNVGLNLPQGLQVQTPPFRLFGKKFFGPNVFADTFGLLSSDRSVAGLRVRPTAVWNKLYFEVGATAWTDFEDGWESVLSEAFVKARPEYGDITVGRQHFLDGPINNSNLGSLIGFDTADAVRWQPKAGDFQLSLSYIGDFIPFTEETQSGWYGRAEVPLLGGNAALNVVKYNTVGTGASVDFSFPVVEGQLDLYGEIGSDPGGVHVATWGAYFPDLYQKHDIDLFLEYAYRRESGSLWSLYGYREFEKDWTAVASIQDSSVTDFAATLGVVKRFR